MAFATYRQSIKNLLEALPSQRLDALKKLFWSELNYNRENSNLNSENFPESLKDKLLMSPLLFATAGEGDGFHVIYCHLNTEHLVLGVERQLVSQLLASHPYGLFLFSDKSQTHWHFVNVKYEKEKDRSKRARRLFRRLTVGPEERLRTAAERIALLDINTLSRDLFGVPPLVIQQRHDEAFNVEAVTEKFFEGYQDVFRTLKESLENQSNDKQWSHEYALQFLNRLMFVYYVQRKRWLGEDPDFLRHFWDAYHDSDHEIDTFVADWLNVLFFEAFNFKFISGRADRAYFPPDISNALALAPYLNGGLFAENKLDRDYQAFISDALFAKIFVFFEQYNFTISEDTPLDQEVAVDPEMIGKVYESLVNVSEETNERGEAGIFYTPRVEIDLMCRLALVDNLANYLGSEHKNLLYEVIFAFDEDDKHAADIKVDALNLWNAVDTHLRNVTVLDPACGSGSFLVGMLQVLDDLRQRANNHLGNEESAYERKKAIIRNSLYGVDVMRWAVHVAELRLWLQLVIDTQMLEPSELRLRPLLPNLSFKIRQGDSLVQEVGGVNLAVRHGGSIPPALKGKLTELKAEKRKIYNNLGEARKYHTEAELRQAELLMFREIVDVRVKSLQTRIQELNQKLRPQTNLFGEVTESQMKLTQVADRTELDRLQSDLEAASRAQTALHQTNDVPFVWDIAFVEVFEDEKGGFDVVVGNPPYVRQEKIRDPLMSIGEASLPDAKKAYKAKLMRSVYTKWVQVFGYDWNKDKAKWNLDAKSDLYIYFFFHGLSLLNPKGAFCFITSNSWLDVGYGKDLQKFLLTRSKVKWIIDNQSRRSFASADVNTVIALFSKPQDDKNERSASAEHIARFVMLTVPFEYTLTPIVWQELEYASLRTSTPEYRLFPIRQSELIANGSDLISRKFVGDKWGGKYLRAHEIFFTIMTKGKEYLDALGNYFDGERYLNTGGADGFFIISDVHKISKDLALVKNYQITKADKPPFQGYIENRFIAPLIKDYTRENRKIVIDGSDSYCIVVKGEPTPNLKQYILWGESQGYHQRSVTKNQKPWYKPTNQMLMGAKILVPRSFNDTFIIHHNPQEILSLRFYRLHLKKGDEKAIMSYLNSTLIAFVLETLGNKSLGQGVLDFFMADFLNLRLPIILNNDLAQAFNMISGRQITNVYSEYGEMNSNEEVSLNVKPDRRDIDNIIFEAIGLTQGEKDAVYESLVQMVATRIRKASSLDVRLAAKELSEMDW